MLFFAFCSMLWSGSQKRNPFVQAAALLDQLAASPLLRQKAPAEAASSA